MNRERILVTGPAGRVGTEIIPLLRPHFALRLLDARPVTAVADDEVLTGDIRDPAIMGRACEGVKALVHLAAISDEDDFPTRLLPINLEGVYSVFEAARKAAVPKVLFASTAQTVLYYPKASGSRPKCPPVPGPFMPARNYSAKP